MTYDKLQTYINLCYYIYLPILAFILIIILILLARSQLKKLRTELKKLQIEPFKNSLLELKISKRHAYSLIYKMVPIVVLFGALTLPFFYLVFQDKQYEYCKEIISINHITSPQDNFFKNKCSFFTPEEFFHNQ